MLVRQLAAALRAEKLILMTDVPGVMRDKDDISTKFTELDIRETRQARWSDTPQKWDVRSIYPGVQPACTAL
jgi:acetylglutamate kinase